MIQSMKYIIVLAITVLLCSCDPASTYVYIIENSSDVAVNLDIFPSGKEDEFDKEYPGYKTFSYIRMMGKENEPLGEKTLIIIHPSEALKFVAIVECSAYVQKNPENDGHIPLWFEHSCIRKIVVVGETEDGKERVIPVEYWSNRDNWIRQNKKKRYVEYWLKIDDSVISQESVLQPIN